MVYSCEFFGCADQSGETAFVQYWRNKSLSISSTYESAWVQDTITMDRWTINAGLRYDVQDVDNLSSTSLANPEVPGLLPDLTFEGNDAGGFEWETIVPRVGVTYALGEERRTLLRGSFSQYAEQLGHSQASRTNPVAYSYASFYFTDSNRNLVLDLSGVSIIDGAFLGLCLMLYKHTELAGGSLKIRGVDATVRRIFVWNAVEWLL